MATPKNNVSPDPMPSGCSLLYAILSSELFFWTDIFVSSLDYELSSFDLVLSSKFLL